MTLVHKPSAILPFQPYPRPTPVPMVSGVVPSADSDPVFIQLSSHWLPYVIGACKALVQDSTWCATSTDLIDSAVSIANDLLAYLSGAVIVYPVQFRFDPTDTVVLQYSTDGGITWLDMPDFAPSFVRTAPDTTSDNTINSASYATPLLLNPSDAVALGVSGNVVINEYAELTVIGY